MKRPSGFSLGRRLPPDPGDEAASRWLEAIATSVYPSDDERIQRVRARILLQARVAARETAALRETPPRRPFITGRVGNGRRAAGLAFGLVLATVSGVAGAESGPGEAFYGVRLAVEDAVLPPAGTAEGVDARLDSLHRRLTEAAAATDQGDDRAAAAALGAYEARLATLFPALGDGVDLTDVAAAGVALPSVAARLSEDDGLVRTLGQQLGEWLGRDHSTATGVITEMTRVRSAIADQVARDIQAREKAGSGNGQGPRATSGNDNVKGKATPSPKVKKKRTNRPLASPTASPTLAP